jgi:hypothetical protein
MGSRRRACRISYRSPVAGQKDIMADIEAFVLKPVSSEFGTSLKRWEVTMIDEKRFRHLEELGVVRHATDEDRRRALDLATNPPRRTMETRIYGLINSDRKK